MRQHHEGEWLDPIHLWITFLGHFWSLAVGYFVVAEEGVKVSRLTDLITRAKSQDQELGADLEREFKALASRLSFGLNFERHRPEAVELPKAPLRPGDKARVLPPRGSVLRGDKRLWRVSTIDRRAETADLELLNGELTEAQTVPLADLVLVADFRDRIYPGLVSTGMVERGGEKPFHTVINGENYHVLKALTYTHRGKIDAIYIDPPYNTGARDWKYNNDYVESDDLYRHSKWLAMMERRLLIAKQLLNPADSVLIVTIDEKEYLRLGLLLEQLFPEAESEMITTVISAKGVARVGQFSRVEEYIYVLRFGAATVALGEHNMLDDSRSAAAQVGKPIEWLGMRRREPTARRGARPNQFYPIFVDLHTGYIHSVGDAITDEVDRNSVKAPAGTFCAWPLRPSGEEGLWGITPETATAYLEKGYIRARNYKPTTRTVTIHYLPSGTVRAVEEGDIEITGRDDDGAIQGVHRASKGVIPKRVWNVPAHNAETGGSLVLRRLLPDRRFPFPKSIYAVEDILRFFVGSKPTAVVLDFFAGSGTTAHAVMRLNRQDGGSRQCISVTNNEVSAEEQRQLIRDKLRPGDAGWEAVGIFEHITEPRIRAVITGATPSGSAVQGDYTYVDPFPMADGFRENAAFFTLTYESLDSVNHSVAFQRIAPLLWLRAGAQGGTVDDLPEVGWAVADTYGLLTDLDKAAPFVEALASAKGVRMVYVVTDDSRRFQSVVRQLPDAVEPIRLYESYLSNFSFLNGEDV